MNLISNIWNHPKTSAAGLLIAIVTIASVLSQQGITLGNAGTGTVVTLISGIATALLGLLARDPSTKNTTTNSTSTTSVLLVLMVFLLLGTTARAQESSSTTGTTAATTTTTSTTSTTATGISFTASTGAAAVIGDGGNKYVIATLSELLDLWDSKADTNGYKNRIYVLGDELVGDSTAGWNYYGGGVRVEPSRTFAGLLKRTNIPADSFKLYFDGSIGNTISTAGVSNVSVLLGGGMNAAVTSSGSVSWHPFQAKWLRRGGKNYGVLGTEIVAKW